MKKVISFTLILLTFLCCASCRQDKKRTEYLFEYFDTVTVICGFENDPAVFKENCGKIKSELSRYHTLFDIYNEYPQTNNLCTVNKEAGKLPVKVDSEITEFIDFCKEIYRKTDGKVNVAMGSVLSIWHSCREEGKALPDSHLLKDAAEHTDIEKIVTDSENGTVFIADETMSIDVGAVAKGYAAQKICGYMKQNGMAGYSISIGGNVCTAGKRKDGKEWTAAVESPFDDSYIEYLSFDEGSLVTSGDYQRYYEVDGKRYHHIIDPKTLMPSGYFCSVSVFAENSAEADALSTALFISSLEEGKKLLEEFASAKAMWVTRGGEKLYSENW